MEPKVIYLGPDGGHSSYLEACKQVRRSVFVEEQGVDEVIDFDGMDEACAHLLLMVDGTPVGTLRIRKTEEGTKLERIAVLKAWRGHGFGSLLVRCGLSLVEGAVYLHAQVRSEGFYRSLGFICPDDEIYYEAEIAHRTMIWKGGRIESPLPIIRCLPSSPLPSSPGSYPGRALTPPAQPTIC